MLLISMMQYLVGVSELIDYKTVDSTSNILKIKYIKNLTTHHITIKRSLISFRRLTYLNNTTLRKT